MSRKVVPFQELLEVVWKPDSVELNDATLELLNAGRVHISVRQALLMNVVEAANHGVHDLQHLLGGKFFLGEGLPLGDVFRTLHFNENELIRHNPVLADFNQVLVPQGSQRLHLSNGFSPLVAVEGANVDASDHGLLVGLRTLDHENLSVALFIVKALRHIVVI